MQESEKTVGAARRLRALLDGGERERAALRGGLHTLTLDELREAMAELPYQQPARRGVSVYRTRCPDGHVRPWWIHVPDGYDPAVPMPLLVCLHSEVERAPLLGRPSVGEQIVQLYHEALPEDARDRVLVLGVSAGARETNQEAVWWALNGQKNVRHFIFEARKRFNVDDSRIFLSGFLDGGSGAYAFACRMPDTFAGILPIFGNPMGPADDGTPVWLENLKGQNIRASAGGRDRQYAARYARPVIEQANEIGAGIVFEEYPTLTRSLVPVLQRELRHFAAAPLSDWRRDLLPKTIDWTCVNVERGERGWLAVIEIGDFGEANAVPENEAIRVPGRPVVLGVQLRRGIELLTVDVVVAGSAAQKAGVQRGDVITHLDEIAVKTFEELVEALETKAPGEEFKLRVLREEEALTLEGRFETDSDRASLQLAAPVVARVQGEFSAGVVTLRSRNAARVAVLVAPAMLDNAGKLEVRIIDKDGNVHLARAAAPVKPDMAWLLEVFETTADRGLPWIARIEIDIAKAVGVKPRIPDRLPPQEDDF